MELYGFIAAPLPFFSSSLLDFFRGEKRGKGGVVEEARFDLTRRFKEKTEGGLLGPPPPSWRSLFATSKLFRGPEKSMRNSICPSLV